MPYIEKTLPACRDCGRPFVFTVEEQEAFAQQGYRNEPSRCQECREIRKARRPAGPAPLFSMGNNRRTEPRTMHPAVCSRCGKATEVPFQPRGDKPVFCRDCYAQEPRRNSY